jgi:hypothetical protein
MKYPRFIVAIFAALAMTVFVNARSAFAQEPAESGTSVDAAWDRTAPTIDRTAPTIDDSASSADEVLEIPQATCNKDDPSAPCDTPAAAANDPNDEAINAPQPGSPPPVLDDDTASSAATDPDWGDATDYQNQQVYAAPYAYPYAYGYGYGVTVPRYVNPQSPVPASAYAPMSSPLTQASRPPLNPGPWMNPPTMSAFSRPAGSPMMGMASSPPLGFRGFHR